MNHRIGCLLVGLTLAVSVSTAALARVDDDPVATDSAVTADTAMVQPMADQGPRPVLFLRVLDPAEDDLEVPLATSALLIHGVTLNDAVVSADGNLVEVDDQGGFSAVAQLDEGANLIDVVASDRDGNQVTTTLYIVRGDA